MISLLQKVRFVGAQSSGLVLSVDLTRRGSRFGWNMRKSEVWVEHAKSRKSVAPHAPLQAVGRSHRWHSTLPKHNDSFGKARHNGDGNRRENRTNGGESDDGNHSGRARWRHSRRFFESMAVAIVSAGGVTALFFMYDRHLAPTPRDLCIDAIAASTAYVSDGIKRRWVRRDVYFNEIQAFLERDVVLEPGYMVVAGARGCGKSTVVLDAVDGRQGVIALRFGGESDTSAIFSTLLKSVYAQYDAENSDQKVKRLFLDVQRKHFADDPKWRPTLVIELERGKTDRVIVEIAKAMKRLSVDLGAAHVILVLGDETEIFALPHDPARQNIVWVEDLSEREAHTLFDHFKFFERGAHGNGSDSNAAVRSRIFNTIGTRAATLMRVMTEASTKGDNGNAYDAKKVDEYIETCSADAKAVVRWLTNFKGAAKWSSGEAFRRLLLELLQSKQVYVGAANKYLVGPSEATRLLKGNRHAIQYHYPTHTYRFHSVAHWRAAEQLKKEGYF